MLVYSSNIPIDINITCKFYSMPTKEYYYYENPNHIICECLTRLDIQQSTAEQ